MSSENNAVVVPTIIGPTCSGKTALSLQLSEYFPCEIISADSRQIYRHLNIGTAKPTPEQLAHTPHHCIDIVNPDEYFSAGLFGEIANLEIANIAQRGNMPIVVGGSGLYIQSLFDGIFSDGAKTDMDARKKATDFLADNGRYALFAEIQKIDPSSALQYSDANPRRLLRVLEYYYATGNRISDAQKTVIKRDCLKPLYIMLNPPREILYRNINARCIAMWDNGLIAETLGILDKGYSDNLHSLNTVGYQQALRFLRGELDRQTCLDDFMQASRNYAKRQITWFKKKSAAIQIQEIDDALKIVLQSIKEQKNIHYLEN